MTNKISGNYAEEVTKTEYAGDRKVKHTDSTVKDKKEQNITVKDGDRKATDKSDKQEPSAKQIKSALEQANQQAKLAKTACEFSYDDATNRISITVKDKDTDEVIREIPGEETLKMISKMWELAGILVDEKL